MKLNYDFHIHSCLSPCAEAEMSPHNIVAMATILELDVIAITDHNSSGNCRAAMEAGKQAGILVVPGMELCTTEEIHLVCLFPEIDRAEAFGEAVFETMGSLKNKPEFFGEQIYMDHLDNIIGFEEKMLINASGISFDQAPAFVRKYGGVCYPAHIDRHSNSVISNLGFIDQSMDFSHVEIANREKLDGLIKTQPILKEKTIIFSSDSHRLETFAQFEHGTIELDRLSPKAVVEWFSSPAAKAKD